MNCYCASGKAVLWPEPGDLSLLLVPHLSGCGSAAATGEESGLEVGDAATAPLTLCWAILWGWQPEPSNIALLRLQTQACLPGTVVTGLPLSFPHPASLHIPICLPTHILMCGLFRSPSVLSTETLVGL